MHITNQHIWNFLFTVFFLVLLGLSYDLLDQYGYRSVFSVTFADIALITLATFRLTRLVVYDKIMEFFRDQFWNADQIGSEVILTKPLRGPRRTLADLLSCPWCFGLWAAATVTFFYFLTPYAFFPVLFFAIAAVASFFQILANLVGWRAEQLKKDVERL